MQKKFKDMLHRAKEMGEPIHRVRALYAGASELSFGLMLIVLFFYGWHLVREEKMEAKDVMTFLLYFRVQLFDNIRWYSSGITTIKKGLRASRQFFLYRNLQQVAVVPRPNNTKVSYLLSI